MVVAPNHMRDLHVHVVHDHAKIVGGASIRTRNDQIVELGILKHHAAVHDIVDHDLSIEGILESNHRRDIRAGIRAVAPAAVIPRFLPARRLARAQLCQFLLGAIAAVGMAARQHVFDHFLVSIEALGLIERALIMLEPRPFHPIENLLDRLVCRTLEIGILDAQHELAGVPARIQPAEERRAQSSDMQESSGARCESGADGHRGVVEKSRGRESSRAREKSVAALHPSTPSFHPAFVLAATRCHTLRLRWAVSSAVEHCFHTAGVTGSIPVPPTTTQRSVHSRRIGPWVVAPVGPGDSYRRKPVSVDVKSAAGRIARVRTESLFVARSILKRIATRSGFSACDIGTEHRINKGAGA